MLIIKTNLQQNYAQSAYNQKHFKIFTLRSPPPGAERRGILYTKQLHNTNQMQASLKDPKAIHIYNTGVP